MDGIPTSNLTRIVWVDSRGAGPTWNFEDQVRDDGLCHVESVGRIIHETDGVICIAPHVAWEGDSNRQVCGEMHIPKSAIQSIEALAVLDPDLSQPLEGSE